jgi:glutamyl-tRNA synthetase
MVRVRFAPSPTGYLHIGGARTFLFNWLYARRQGGVMILRIDDTDLERNTEESLRSIFEGLEWMGLDWDEQYRQSDRLNLHREAAQKLLANGWAYRDFTPAGQPGEQSGPLLANPEMRGLSPNESARRAEQGEPFVIRFRVPHERGDAVEFRDYVYGEQSKAIADIEDFALLRSDGMPTYHLASCLDDLDLKITHVLRGQEHLANTFKHLLILEGLAAARPEFAHFPLLLAPDGAKLSKRIHGPVVSVTTYRDGGFVPQGFVNFLALLGWSPKDDREELSREELINAFSFEGVHRSNAIVNFKEDDPFDPKAIWLNQKHLRGMPLEELVPMVRRVLEEADIKWSADETLFAKTIDLIRARYSTLLDFATKGRPYFQDDYEITPDALVNLDKPQARELVGDLARQLENNNELTEQSAEAAIRALAGERGVKAGVIINAARAALTGQAVGPSAFALFPVLGRERVIRRLAKAARPAAD